MKNLILFLALTLISIFSFSACQKEEVEEGFTDVTEELMMQKAVESADDDADEVTIKCNGCNAQSLRDRLPACANVTDSGPGVFPRTIVIDYGAACTDRHGRVKSGRIIIEITDQMHRPNAVRTMTFDSFYVDGRQLIGGRVVTNITTAADVANHQMVFSVVGQVQAILPDGRIISHTVNGIRRWVAGVDTPHDCSDDAMTVEGTATVTCSNGHTIVRTITTPVLFIRGCRYPVSGVVEIVNSHSGHTTIIDFGAGNCDDEATATRNGRTRIIDLDDVRIRRHH